MWPVSELTNVLSRLIYLCTSCIFWLGCASIEAPYTPSVGGRHPGYYEIYLCNGLFDMYYANPGADIEGVNAVFSRRVRELKTAYGYTAHESLGSDFSSGSGEAFWEAFIGGAFRGAIGLRPSYTTHSKSRPDIHEVIVRFYGNQSAVPEFASQKSAYLYVNRITMPIHVKGKYDSPRFLKQSDRIEVIPEAEDDDRTEVYVNYCRGDKLTIYPIARGSVFHVNEKGLLFEKGGIIDCQTQAPGNFRLFRGDREKCSFKPLTQLE